MTIKELLALLAKIEDQDREVILAADNESGLFSELNEVTTGFTEITKRDTFVYSDDESGLPDAAKPALILWPVRNSIDD
jgi:hypothetical protein